MVMRLKFLFILTYFVVVIPTYAQTANEAKNDSSINENNPKTNIRGIENSNTYPDENFRSFLNVLFFIPRKTIDGLLFSSIYGARLIFGSKEIERADDYFLKNHHKFVWYPLVILDSDLRLNVGLNLLYRWKPFGMSFKGDYTSKYKWESQLNLTYVITRRYGLWKVKMRGTVEEDDDRKFYGIGSDPPNDNRNIYVPNSNSEYGVYSRRRRKIEIILGFRPARYLEFFLSTFYQERQIWNKGNTGPLIGEVFDINRLPGVNQDVKQFYNEFSVRLDNRKYPGRLTKGFMVESFVGLSEGQKEDKSKFVRAGFNIAGFIPIIKQNRLIVPRLLYEVINNQSENIPIPFVEYPQSRQFRGIGSNKIFRTDNHALIPSLEYQWPLSTNLNAHLFHEYLLVSRKMGSFSLSNAVWATGFGIDFHNIQEEIIRIELITGSDGLRITINFGISNYIRRNVD
jgi:hypothetical protein